MMLAVIGGVAASVGLLGLVFSLRSPAHRLADVLSAVDRDPDNRPGQTPGRIKSDSAPGWRVDRTLAGYLAEAIGSGRLAARLAPDLQVTGSHLEDRCAQSVVGAFAGAALPSACWAILAAGGIRVSWTAHGVSPASRAAFRAPASRSEN
jgi:hypothetical protein